MEVTNTHRQTAGATSTIHSCSQNLSPQGFSISKFKLNFSPDGKSGISVHKCVSEKIHEAMHRPPGKTSSPGPNQFLRQVLNRQLGQPVNEVHSLGVWFQYGSSRFNTWLLIKTDRSLPKCNPALSLHCTNTSACVARNQSD